MRTPILAALLLGACSALAPELGPSYPVPVPDESVDILPAPEALARDICERYCDRLAVCSPDAYGLTCVADCAEVLTSDEQQRATGMTQERTECYAVSENCGKGCQ
jgi:hypothetical protein